MILTNHRLRLIICLEIHPVVEGDGVAVSIS
jgi:hypothetical protein